MFIYLRAVDALMRNLCDWAKDKSILRWNLSYRPQMAVVVAAIIVCSSGGKFFRSFTNICWHGSGRRKTVVVLVGIFVQAEGSIPDDSDRWWWL